MHNLYSILYITTSRYYAFQITDKVCPPLSGSKNIEMIRIVDTGFGNLPIFQSYRIITLIPPRILIPKLKMYSKYVFKQFNHCVLRCIINLLLTCWKFILSDKVIHDYDTFV